MNGTKEVPAGVSLAAHFETKRRILATVKQMEKRGEKLKEATPEEILEAAIKSEETVFKFDFSISDEAQTIETSSKKHNRNRKRNSKRRSKNKLDKVGIKIENVTSGEVVDVVPVEGKRDKSLKEEVKSESFATSSFLKLRKATGTESEVAKMRLRYGKGRRNLAAMKQREQRKKMTDASMMETTSSNEFKFNFTA